MEIKSGRGYVYTIQYHIVWCVKYRHKIISDRVEMRLIELLKQIANDNGFTIVEINTDKDHIHLLIDCSPQHYIPDMIKALKGVSARLLMKEFGDWYISSVTEDDKPIWTKEHISELVRDFIIIPK